MDMKTDETTCEICGKPYEKKQLNDGICAFCEWWLNDELTDDMEKDAVN